VVLESGKSRRPDKVGSDSKIIDPVYIESGVTIFRSTVGPNVSIGAGTVVEGSTLSDTIVGSKSTIKDSKLSMSMIGDEVVVEGFEGEVTVGDHSEVRVAS
jgi:glucose-1-phosphate thymidylyltransferase